MNRYGKRCVLYPRVSTEMQVDGYSLEGQKNMLTRFADREEMIIVDTYEDAGKSGKSIEGRPAFQKMLRDIEDGLDIDYILVYKLSRFGRNAADILNSLELVQSYGVNLICIEEGIDSSQTSGKLLISVLSAVAEIERENIIEQTMNGRREKARQGGWNGGFAPYGYTLEDNKLMIEETEAVAIRKIFELYTSSEIGLGGIANQLNLQGIRKIPRQNGTLEDWTGHFIIREYQTFYLNDEKWKDHLTRQGGPEAWAEDHASREAFLTEIIPYMELHCNLSRLEQEAQTRLASSDTLTPEETAYYGALVDYAMECRPLLNHGEPLPEMPKLTDFDQSLQDYKAQVEAEIAQEAADAGMTVEEYAAAGYEAPAQPQEVKEPPQQEAPEQQTKEPAASDYYYSINEGAARRAKEMNSFSDYKPGSATAEYRHYVDKAFALAQEQKKRVDPMYHEKIDSLLDTYARKLAANMNHGYEIDARVPSILIAGGSNFPVRQKEKQNAARDSNMQEWQYIQGLLDKIRSTGMGGIRQDDPQAIPKLQKKLAGLEKAQETMKAVNAYYRKHGTLDGCPHLSPENLENLKADMASGWHYEKKPFQSWELSNNNAEIRRVRQRIESLTRANEVAYVGWEFDGGHVEANREQGRLQVFFDGKPEADARQQLKEHGFRWAPSVGAWQRLLNDNAYYASDRIACIQPLSGIKPTELQRNSSREQRAQAAQEQAEPDYFYRVHANPRSDSRENLYMLQAYIPQDNGRAKIGDVLYVGTPERCRELMDQLNTGELTQEAVKELYGAAAGRCAGTCRKDADRAQRRRAGGKPGMGLLHHS